MSNVNLHVSKQLINTQGMAIRKFACVKAINTLGMANPCHLIGGSGACSPEENFVKIG